MRYLIDTHVLIWFINGDNALPDKYVELLGNTENELHISVASLWEIAIKIGLNKLKIDKSLPGIEAYILSRDFKIFNISFNHLNSLLALPHHHGDPFDRLIIVQAIAENLTIISADRHFSTYNVPLLW